MNKFTILKFLSYKYKISAPIYSRESSIQAYGEKLAILILIIILTIIEFLLLKILPSSILSNINKYIVIFYALICIISISVSIKSYYNEYFESLERDILTFIPIKKYTLINIRFFTIIIDVVKFLSLIFIPFIIACYFSNLVNINFVILSLIQLINIAIFSCVLTNILFSFAFFISKGKGLKIIAYSLVIVVSILTSVIIIFTNNYSSLITSNNTILNYLFFTLSEYPKNIIQNNFSLNYLYIFTCIIYNLMLYILSLVISVSTANKGFLSISSRELKNSVYSYLLTNLINSHLNTGFLKKDILYIIRQPQSLSQYISPILVILLIEFKSSFFTDINALIFLVCILTTIIVSITLYIIQFNDTHHNDFLLSINIESNTLFKDRSNLIFIISSCISSTIFIILSIFRWLEIKYFISLMLLLLVINYSYSIIVTKKIILNSYEHNCGYKYEGKLILPTLYFIFIYEIPLVLLFILLLNSFNLNIIFQFMILLLIVSICLKCYNTKKNMLKETINE